MNEIVLYDYQTQAVEALRDNIKNGIRTQVLCAPTGSGKTVMATYLIQAAKAKGSRAMFLCDRIALINQTSATLDQYGIEHGVIQANHWRHFPDELIQVASQNTLERRGWPDGVDLMIVDECHTMRAQTTEQIQKSGARVIGLTATPFTPGMADVYQAIVSVTTTNKLIDQGKLAPFTIFAPATIDMDGATVNKFGEWSDAEVESRAIRVVGDVVENYLKFGHPRKFIAFGSTVRHCEEMREALMNAGVRCELYTNQTSDGERDSILAEYRKPDSAIRGLVSVAALSKGFDVPDVSCLIIARPLRKSKAEHIQIVGRGLRADPADPDKKCVIIDHAENCVRFGGFMADFFENSVDELPKEEKRSRKKLPLYDYYATYFEGDQVRHNGKEWEAAAMIGPGKIPETDPSWKQINIPEIEWRTCPECKNVHKPSKDCPNCGFEYPRKTMFHEEGELANIEMVAAAKVEQMRWYAGILHRAYKLKLQKPEGWAAHKFRDKFGIWPSPAIKQTPASTPDTDVAGWLDHKYIAYLKAKEKARYAR